MNLTFPTFHKIGIGISNLFKIDNFFKIILAFSALTIACSFAFGKFIEIKKHNLDVAVQTRLCQTSNLDAIDKINCNTTVRRQKINYFSDLFNLN